jgi:Na+/H+-dicarboxylate symporter
LLTRTRPRLSLSSQVVLGLVLGIVVGVGVGELATFLHTIGKAFILLLQMTLLPYISLSLITGLGHLSYEEVKTLVLKVGSLLMGSGLCRHSPHPLHLSGLAVCVFLQYCSG